MDPLNVTDETRIKSMGKVNPKFILRNYLLEEAIRAADDNDDFSKVESLFAMACDPFNDDLVSEIVTKPPPKWAYDYCVSCSS